MSSSLGERFLRILLVMFGVSVLVFFTLNFLPGDTATILMAGTPTSAQAMERIREYMALDEPLPTQFLNYIGRLLHGDLGWSLRHNRPVLDLILESLNSTVVLALSGLGVAVVLGLIAGILAGIRPNTWLDNLSLSLALVGISVPEFWLGLVLMTIFAIHLNWLPITGQGGIRHLILPAVSLGLPASAIIARLMRSRMMEVMTQDYILVAHGKGLSERAVVLRHALKNALIPVVTVIGLQFGRLMGGAVVVETVFARHGLGRLTINAILVKDIPLVQGIVLFAAFTYVLANATVDIIYRILDPRIKVT